MFIQKRTLRYFDWISFLFMILLMAIGLLFVFSATYRTSQPYSLFFKKQLFGICAGIFFYIFCSIIDYRWFMQWSVVAYATAVFLLVITIVKGSIGMGAKRWINLIFFKVQPSELVKLFFPTFTSTYLYYQKDYFTYSLAEFAPIITTLLISFILIVKQPDLGTALILLFSGLIMLWLAGLNKKFFLYGCLLLVCTAPLSWSVLRPYQKKRVLVFLGKGEKSKERYQLEQSKIAIGSGGLTGKGFLKGTQNKYLFLPEGRTDLIFCVLCEEMGFVGACTLLLLYALFFIHLLYRASRIADVPLQLLACGIIVPIILSAFINLCMVLGLLPIVGIPLPLMSYGLSNLWVTCASLGFFNTIIMHNTQTNL